MGDMEIRFLMHHRFQTSGAIPADAGPMNTQAPDPLQVSKRPRAMDSDFEQGNHFSRDPFLPE